MVREFLPLLLMLEQDEVRNVRGVLASSLSRYHDSLKALQKNRVICIPSWKYRLLVALVTNPLTKGLLRVYYQRGLKK